VSAAVYYLCDFEDINPASRMIELADVFDVLAIVDNV